MSLLLVYILICIASFVKVVWLFYNVKLVKKEIIVLSSHIILQMLLANAVYSEILTCYE